MKKRILVTGAGGFIGGNFIRRLAEDSTHEIHAVTLGQGLADVASVNWISCPLIDLDRNYTNLFAPGFDCVYHLAAFTPATGAMANLFLENYQSNIAGTFSLLRLLQGKTRKFIFASTLDVYKNGCTLPMDENSPTAPSTFYGQTKLFGEKMVSTYCQTNGIDFSILRIGHVYGPGEEKYGKIIPVLLRNSIEGNTTTITGDGSAKRDFIFISDVCKILEEFSNINWSVPVNISAGRQISIREAAETINQVTCGQTNVVYTGDATNAHSVYFDNSLLVSLLDPGFVFTRFEEGISREFEYLKEIIQS